MSLFIDIDLLFDYNIIKQFLITNVEFSYKLASSYGKLVVVDIDEAFFSPSLHE